MKIGVIIARCQLPNPHEGHLDFFNQVSLLCDQMVFCLGITPVKMSNKDPLNFETRRIMLQRFFPKAEFYPLFDQADNSVWSKKLDDLLIKTHPYDDIVLYGSRGSFIDKYSGKFETIELEAKNPKHNATEIRNEIANTIIDSVNYRTGIIAASFDRYPISYQTVDIAIIDFDKHKILLGQKPDETLWRFPGGFVDPIDETLEFAAHREASEEIVNTELDDMTYITSMRISDWRYKDREDKIMTAFFACHYVFGACQAGDDLAHTKWVDLNSFIDIEQSNPLNILIDGHYQLMQKLIKSNYFKQLPYYK